MIVKFYNFVKKNRTGDTQIPKLFKVYFLIQQRRRQTHSLNMGTIMQRLRDRIYNQTFIILPRQSEENSNQEDASLQNESNIGDSAKDCLVDSKSENLSHESVDKEKSSSAESNILQQKKRGNDSSLTSSEAKEFEVYLKKLFANLKHDNSIETRCSGTLNLAVCLAIDSPDIEIADCLEALKDVWDSHNFPQLAVCHALLLCGFTKMSMSLEHLIRLEESVVALTECLRRKNIAKMPDMYKVGVLIEEHEEIVFKLCQEIFKDNYLDLTQIDILTICCCALSNISSLVKQYDNDLGATYNFKDSTLKFILVMTGRSTQEIVSENLSSSSLKYSCPSMNLFRLKQCLHVLEHALSITPDLSYRSALHQESSSLPHCLTRLLGWSVSYVFPIKDKTGTETDNTDSSYFPFHLSTLVCILKILSILSFNPHQYDSFSNVKGLMEKILICTLKAYFESEKNHFDIQILCLEMLINLYIKNQKTFILLCLKRFRISDTEEVLAVEALLKMLSDNLEKIKEVKGQYPQGNNKAEPNVNCKESTKDTNEDSQNEDPIKKPRKENVENVSKEDTPNIRKEASEEVSKDAIKKPRKENFEGVCTENSKEKPPKTVEDTSSDASKGKPSKEATAESDAVLQAASKDMEHSTIVSFICVLIVFFMRTKQNFKEFILERLTADSLREATTVSQKFLEFASLTGGMPVTGILILSQTITKLQSLQSS